MKLMQLNCWGGKLVTQLNRLIEKEKPDIVCLQEAYHLEERPGSVMSPPSAFLPKTIYPYEYRGSVYSIKYMHELADFGNTIISKFPFMESNIVFTRGKYFEDMESLENDYNIRNFIHTVIEYKGKKLNVITHHGHHDPKGKEGTEENTRQLNILSDYMDTLKGQIILTGDFNLHANSKSLAKINKQLINLPQRFNIKSTRTILAKRQEVIDYIFVSKDVKVKEFAVSEEIVSDHKALILEFDL